MTGSQAYQTFDKAVILEDSMRQATGQEVFRDLLHRVRNGKITEADVKVLESRDSSKLTENERSQFINHGIFVFGERNVVTKYNE